MKKKFRGISLIIVILLVTTFISVKTSEANDVATQPNFIIQNLKATPDLAKIGEDILVTGEIVPQDFETTVQPKEIVLVLDTSGSMDDTIKLDEECTEIRIENYCTKHKSSDPNHKEWIYSKHNWTKDYCKVHKISGNHTEKVNSTKIKELKKAANTFIETMKDVPNLKIGIVAYSTNANINPIENLGIEYINTNGFGSHKIIKYKSYNQNFLSADDSKLNDIIGCIESLGGTNTGEGLRKALYMLNKGGKNANKTIVLMSDGLPTFASSNISIDSLEYGTISGIGTGENDTNSLDYAKKIGNIVKEKGYNSYSIGYGLSNKGTDYFKQIHSSMKGLPLNTEANETNGFFAKSDGSITEIFKQIAENIKASYDLNEVSLELEFNQGFKLNIEGNEVNIGNIIYKKVSESAGRVVYHAEPVNFNFVVKASEIGENQSIFRNLYIKYPWNETKERMNIQSDLKVGIIANELPIINARLSSDKEVTLNKNETVTIKYDISPEEFEFKDINNTIENDVVIVIDASKDMEGKINIVKDNIFNKIINNDKLKNSKTDYDLITFSNKIDSVIDLKSSSYENYQSYITDLNDNYLKKINIDNSNSKNINTTYEKIINLLENGRSGAGKNVIFISSTSNISYESKELDLLKAKKYNIITLAIENTNNNNNKNYLNQLHKDLDGLDNNYFYAYDQNEIGNSIMEQIADRLISGTTYKPYSFNPVIKLDLGDKFEAVSGIEKVEGNIATIKIPTAITYNYSNEDKKYHANKVEVEFTIKPKMGKYGILNLGEIHKLFYEKLIGGGEKYSLITEIPTIKVKQDIKDLEHGLYEGVKDNSIKLYNPLEGSETIISPGATVTFGAKFITSNDDFELALDRDVKFNKIETSDIKVYKLDKTTSSLVEITNPKDETNGKNLIITNPEDNKFIIKASNLNNNSEDTEIVVIYKGKIGEKSENELFENYVTISSLKAKVEIKSGSSSNSNTEENEKDYQGVLPDLF